MQAKKKGINSERVELGHVLPLECPFTLNIFISSFCNFKCNYCFHTLEKEQIVEKYGPIQKMDLPSFQKVIDGLSGFQSKLKTIIISGNGEPLLNSELPEMIAYAASKKVSERIELITNASLLTHELSDRLIHAGLTALRVSVQGVSAQKYREISGVDIDFDAFVEQIQYFYKKKEKSNCIVYCKTVDAALDDGDEERFYSIFSNCCDFMNVEKVVVFEDNVKYKGIEDIGKNKNKNNMDVTTVKICPIPFFSLDVYADGMITNCHIRKQSARGNLSEKTLFEVWNGKDTRQYWMDLLEDCNNDCCDNCHFNVGLLKSGDNIDPFAEQIKNKIGALK